MLNQKNNFIFYDKRWHVVLLILIPIVIYFQCIGFDYTNFDDNGILLEKFNIVSDIKNILVAFKVDAFFNPKGDFYRPVQNITYMLDAQVSGRSLWMFHITNLLIHVCTVISIYVFLQKLQLKRQTAFFMALLFAVHPLFASGVAWVPSRGDILIGLLGLLLFITFYNCFKKNKWLWFGLHTLTFIIILFTKETSILFPILLVYFYFFLIITPQEFSFKKNTLAIIPFVIVWIIGILFYLFLRHKVSSNTGATADVFGIIPFFKNNTVIPTIIGKFFVPIRLSTFPLYENISTIIGIVFLLALLFITIEFTKNKKWAVLMGLLWFGLFAIPPTIYRLENADIFFNYLEHRTYLPMIGILIILSFWINNKLEQPKFKSIFKFVFPLVILFFGIAAYIHGADYKNGNTVRLRGVQLNNPSSIASYAVDCIANGDTANALKYIEKAIELTPKDATMFFERGKIRSKMGQHELAENDYSIALGLAPNASDALMARSVERRYLKKYESAFRDIFKAITADSLNPKVYNSLGNLFFELRNCEEAINSYTKAIQLQPSFYEPYNNRACAKILLKDYKGAIKDCYAALNYGKNKNNPIIYNNIGFSYRELQITDSAFFYIDKAISIKPDFAQAYYERSKTNYAIKNISAACLDLKKSLALGFIDTIILEKKFCK